MTPRQMSAEMLSLAVEYGHAMKCVGLADDADSNEYHHKLDAAQDALRKLMESYSKLHAAIPRMGGDI